MVGLTFTLETPDAWCILDGNMPYAKASSSSVLPMVVMETVRVAREADKTIVLVTGVFDVLHQEHKIFLEKAKAVGEVLVVAIESDRRVTKLKGPGRPINNEQTRLENLVQWGIADVVFVLPDEFDTREDYVSLIETLHPQILAVSANTPHIDRKQAVMALVNGEVRVVHEHNPEVSTTQILAQRAQLS